MELHSEVDQSAAEQAVRDLLAALGHDVSSERLLLTPQRVVKTLRDLTEPAGRLSCQSLRTSRVTTMWWC